MSCACRHCILVDGIKSRDPRHAFYWLLRSRKKTHRKKLSQAQNYFLLCFRVSQQNCACAPIPFQLFCCPFCSIFPSVGSWLYNTNSEFKTENILPIQTCTNKTCTRTHLHMLMHKGMPVKGPHKQAYADILSLHVNITIANSDQKKIECCNHNLSTWMYVCVPFCD